MSINRKTKPEGQKKLFDEIDTLEKERKELEKNIDKTIEKIKEWRKKK